MSPRALILREADRLGEHGKARDVFYAACFVSASLTAAVLIAIGRRLSR